MTFKTNWTTKESVSHLVSCVVCSYRKEMRLAPQDPLNAEKLNKWANGHTAKTGHRVVLTERLKTLISPVLNDNTLL